MADSIIEAIYATLKGDSTFMGYVGNFYYPYVTNEGQLSPHATMFEVDDPRVRQTLCDTESGDVRIQFTYLADTFEDCVNTIENMITSVRDLLGDYVNIKIDRIDIGPTRDLVGTDQAEAQKFVRTFDGVFVWRKI